VLLTAPDDTADLVIWTSIESNTLVIASCIPILQPLIDRLRGKRSRAATPSAGRFSPYPPAARPRTLNPQSAYEMSFACRGAGATRRDLESVTEIEADAKDDAESQDSILGHGGGGGSPRSQGGSSAAGSGAGSGGSGGIATGYHYHHGHQAPVRPPEDGIMRTNVITISYDERRPDSSCSEIKPHPAQWRPKNGY